MATIEITCEDCGETRTTSWKNTKLCRECRLLRNIAFNGKREMKCQAPGCKEKFLPIARGEKYCAYHTPLESNIEVECAFCGKTEFSVLNGIKTCSYCARNPIHRRGFQKALIRRQRERVERYHGDTMTT